GIPSRASSDQKPVVSGIYLTEAVVRKSLREVANLGGVEGFIPVVRVRRYRDPGFSFGGPITIGECRRGAGLAAHRIRTASGACKTGGTLSESVSSRFRQ